MVKISFIVPVYNTLPFLERCLTSITSQSLQDIEVICINDCSTDESAKKLEEWEKKDSRIRVIQHDVNMGLSGARNTGMNAAIGEYMWLIDSDDSLSDKEAAKELYDRAINNRLNLLTFDLECIFENDSLKKRFGDIKRNHCELYPICCSGEKLFSLQMNNNGFMSPAVVYLIERKWAMNLSLQFDDVLHEDMLFAPEAMMKAERAGYFDRVCYTYYRREGSITSSEEKAAQKASSCAYILTELFTRIGKENIEQETKVAFGKYFKVLSDALCRYEIDCLRLKQSVEFKRPSDSLAAGILMEERYTYIAENLSMELCDEILKADHLIVYGAGHVSKVVCDFLQKLGRTDYRVAVTEPDGKSGVYALSEITEKNALVLICALKPAGEQMKIYAESLGFNHCVGMA